MPGLLDNVRQKIGGLLSEAASVRELFSGRVGGQTLEQGIQNRMQPNSLRPALSPQQMVDAGMNIVGMAPLGMTVYHGSPHKFDKFDMSKIGTGEGNQAFGHGLYVAENQAVAKDYQFINAQINPEEVTYGGKSLDYLYNAAQKAQERAHRMPNSPIKEKAIQKANAELGLWESMMTRNHPKQVIDQAIDPEYGWPEQAAFAKSLDFNKFGGVDMSPGQLYKVDIPDEAVARMLDWDKPLSEQSQYVLDALAKSKNKQVRAMLEYAQTPYSADIGGESKTMGEAFRLLNLNLHGKSAADSAKASALLAKQGIPGIRYLDGGSRTAGNGTSNFVLFDDQLPRILERNGIPTGLKPWGPGEWGGL